MSDLVALRDRLVDRFMVEVVSRWDNGIVPGTYQDERGNYRASDWSAVRAEWERFVTQPEAARVIAADPELGGELWECLGDLFCKFEEWDQYGRHTYIGRL